MKRLLQLTRFLLIKQDIMEVYYIQGSDVLPKPLDKEEGLVALIALESGDEETRNTLIEHDLCFVACIAEHYEINPASMEGLVSIGSIGLIRTVNTFRWNKGTRLVTYASCCIGNKILMFLRKKSHRKVEASFDKPLNTDCDGNELLFSDILGTDDDVMTERLEKKENKRELLEAMPALRERECQILQMHCGIQHEELTRKDIAKCLGISQSYISRLEKHVIAKLKIQMKNSQ